VDEENDGVRRLTAAFGLTYAGLAFSGDGQWVRQGVEVILRELRRQILADGGHVSRSPAILADILNLILALEAAMQARTVQVPATLVETRKRMQAMLALICHSDGGLGLFNGATARAAIDIAPLLAGLDTKNVMS
ncbi:MAG: heparinase II/III family protein, partial [Pseudomonadota bacterium]|nr:heparinase II/III family protein [Pseudomonadota bacterium]